ncbi:WD40 repeat domain-containing protein [Aspergillus novofumigatus IBT 16806]|uniref:Mitochondrial division protein 1 n=1 Tax=Aspergillus novofumigatus (strain IBT 16806) TaxID=1392255 RepID=A0A2I1BV66_ASPN1|nr:WD40 repeat-like protein [Aspergillus novofumigatus IBT 16806]PKX89254.1 WD40 repeat-like protein [Aspergillus novofumigatus IBT 16806]
MTSRIFCQVLKSALAECAPLFANLRANDIHILCGETHGSPAGREIKQLKREFQDIVRVIILLATPLSVTPLAQLLNLPRDDISNCLDGFHSVLHVPEDIKSLVHILHLSFRDYLLVTESHFHVDEKQTHERTASHCLHVMDTSLKHNICSLASYGTLRMDIDYQAVNKHLVAELEYSCRYWAYHLRQSGGCLSESQALSLIGIISEAAGIIESLQSSVWNFFMMQGDFTLKYAYIASIAPLQPYCSALVFSPLRSTIRQLFIDCVPKWLLTLPQAEDSWSLDLQTLEGHCNWVDSVAFSPDRQTLASRSSDNTIKIWDIKTARGCRLSKLRTLKGHSNSVRSVAFSPDGQMLASGSGDDTIKTWDAKAGTVLQTLKGHSDFVQSVAFCPDGQALISGSSDHTIKIRDFKSGTELQALKNHSNSAQSAGVSQLVANMGHTGTIFYSIPPQNNNYDSTSHSSKSTVSLSNSWLVLTGENLPWLPPEHRRYTCFALKDATLAMGYYDGRVSIIGFHSP